MYALGIDLGTANTAVACWRDGRAEVVPLGASMGAPSVRSCPSIVLVQDDGGTLAGTAAAQEAAAHPDRVIRGFKRRFGDDVPYLVGGREVTAEELTGHLLRWVLRTAREALGGGAPSQLAVTVPATWQDYRLERMGRVAVDVGVPCPVSFMPEPAAAAVYYAARDHVRAGGTVAVYDFGGGTFDATVLRKTSGGFETLGPPMGLDTVGGEDLDEAMFRLVVAELGPAWPALDRTDVGIRRGVAQLREAAVRAKEELSTARKADIPVLLPGLTRVVTIQRPTFEAAIEPLVDETIVALMDVVDLAGLAPRDLDGVLLVGGSSQIPSITARLGERLSVPTLKDVHPKHAVCLGAAVAAGSLLRNVQHPPSVEVPTTTRPQCVLNAPLRTVTAPADDGSTTAVLDDVSATAVLDDASDTVIDVDLVAHGLTDAGYVPVRPAAELLRSRSTAVENEVLTADLGQDDAYDSARRRAVVLAGLLIAGVLLAFLMLLDVR
jgi:molecular chaperone DnaK (HSP70)